LTLRLKPWAAALAWPVQHGLADPALLAVLQQRLTSREQALRADGCAPRVEAWLRRHLTKCARPTLDEAAAALHLSPRGLQHRLQQEGISFRDLADAVAEQAARAWLLQGQRVVDVAQALGFSDERTFGRAYRRWTGTTPARVLRRR
jgi:AraC-like DNA-binding protein